MAVTACKNEPAVVHRLDVGTQQRFYILFGVARDLLEFVYCKYARFVGILKIPDNLLKSEFGGVYISEFQIESGRTGKGIVSKTS